MPPTGFFRLLLLLLLFPFMSSKDESANWIPSRVLGMSYPQVARAARIDGLVEAKCMLGQDGSVSAIEIVSGHPLLIAGVKANLLQWTFGRDKAINVDDKLPNEVVVEYRFQLKGNCDKYNRCKEEFWYEVPNHVTIVSEMPNLNTGKANTRAVGKK